MNYIDIFIFIILALGAVKGFSRGLVLEFFSLVSFFVSILVAIKFSGPIVNLVLGDSNWYTLALIIVFIMIFLIINLTISALAKILKKGIDVLMLGWLDSILGSILGVLKWAFTLSVIISIFKLIGTELPKGLLSGSLLFDSIQGIAPAIFDSFGRIFPFMEDLFDKSRGFGKTEHFV